MKSVTFSGIPLDCTDSAELKSDDGLASSALFCCDLFSFLYAIISFANTGKEKTRENAYDYRDREGDTQFPQ